MKIPIPILVAFASVLAPGGLVHADDTPPSALVDFPVARVQALVDLYREGGDHEKIAVPMLMKLGPAARTELLSMRRASKDEAEVRALTEILTYYLTPAPETTEAKNPEAEKKQTRPQKKVARKISHPAPVAEKATAVKVEAAEKISAKKPARPLNFGSFNIVNPPSLATRF